MKKAAADSRLEALLNAALADPFGYLGLHQEKGQMCVRCFLPGAEAVAVIDAASGQVAAALPQVHAAGVFAGPVGRKERFAYRLRARYGGEEKEFEDIYRFGPVLGEMDRYLLAEGTHLEAYDRLGAQPTTLDGVPGIGFAVWAPNARSVSVVGDFNGWDGRRHPMRVHPSCGVWDLFIPHLEPGRPYKFELHGPDGGVLPLKADPYAAQSEHPPATASIISAPSRHDWRDREWMERRAEVNSLHAPISIYEAHLGSWRRKPEDGNRYLTYRELAAQLVPYVADLGFTHLEVLPVTEFPFDGSWGYQTIGMFAPTSRFGTPDDFRYFVDACHAAGIALWVDWVGSHFPTDAHGLAYFDGTHLYEHADPRQGFQRDWNTLVYNFGRREVANFLANSALCWLKRYHVDGLRFDAVASMLYLDYSRREGEWIPNAFGGRENLEAIALLRRLNELAFSLAPGATTAAEESTAWPSVSRPTYLGGLGFGFKWNMGWMHDTLRYMALDPVHRQYHHHDLTFGLLYAFSENFILPLSHDEVVHGKGSLIAKMPGDGWQKFANLRAYYGFMWAHPGKKLLFMGGEFAQGREWSYNESLDWHLLDIDWHRGVQSLVRDLNHLYRELPSLHRFDCSGEGFEWIDATDTLQSVLSFIRKGAPGESTVLAVCNFTPVPRPNHRIGVPAGGWWTERINTDAADYGGGGMGNGGGVMAEAIPAHGRSFSVNLTLPPLSTTIFVHRG
ncbi:MAG TPA: 1,4-alpha-glucan branching protein GlgB [Opitutaceae bacterium]|jgi:1,4-alpha-glucan branching enzyme|nr:1,4-alpha-glucan branching protein GlgB [Opitutaceae bacterium]